MSKMADHMEWEKEAPKLAKLKRTTPFTVPSNYFEELNDRVNQSVFISALEKHEYSGFKVPDDYFEDLERQITSIIHLSQLEIGSREGFAVPDGYFEKLSQNITVKTGKTQQVIKLWHRPFFKYTVAACLTVVCAAGWFVNDYNQNKQLNKAELAREQMLYDIDESVIMEYMQEAQNVKTASFTDSEMESYILDNFSTSDLSNNL